MVKAPPPLPAASPAPRMAFRDAVALIRHDPTQLHAALEVARYLAHEHDDDAPESLVAAFVGRGDLPRAVLAAIAADASMEAIAKALGEGSKRLGDAPPAPPPLPAGGAKPEDVDGDLVEVAKAALAKAQIPADPGGTLPRLPLFSDLTPAPLTELLDAFEEQDLEDGDVIIAEGEEGTEAFVLAEGMLAVVREDGTLLAKLGPGALFGEMALVSDAPRAATVKAEGPGTVLSISRDELEELAIATPEIGQRLAEFCRGRMVSNLLRHSEVLSAVPREQRHGLISRFETAHFEPGDVIIEAGSENDRLSLIASGGVVVEGEGGVQIASLGPGEVAGEISLVLRRPANATVRAEHPTVALQLDRDAFQEVIRDHPTLLAELYDTALQRDEETRSLVAVEAVDGDEVVLV
ncbi:MAG: cyclic nucleotide-binding domain-containing protein [Myxococcota bacterium]